MEDSTIFQAFTRYLTSCLFFLSVSC